VIPHHHIDLGTVLRGAVCALYSNLVTRPTGAAVRTEIERVIAESGGRTVTVIDFSQVTLLDFSCADEIVAKLMLRYCAPLAPTISAEAGAEAGYFVFRGLRDHHLDAVEAVLERHGLAIVALLDGRAQVIGEVELGERRAWDALHRLAPCDAHALARPSGRRDAGRADGARAAGAPAPRDAGVRGALAPGGARGVARRRRSGHLSRPRVLSAADRPPDPS
jgi:hypothetical protein